MFMNVDISCVIYADIPTGPHRVITGTVVITGRRTVHTHSQSCSASSICCQ